MPSLPSLGRVADKSKFLQNPTEYVAAAEAVSKRSQNESSLAPETTARQFKTARDILNRLCGNQPLKGVLLADDVGLGKTPIGVLVAWVVASARKVTSEGNERCKVRILAPNAAMQRRWASQLATHAEYLNECGFDADKALIKIGGARLHEGRINVVKHSIVITKAATDCDLLIIDEAHRAKGENSLFRRKLKKWVEQASRVLILRTRAETISGFVGE